jgi:two-component system sensor histidine kinase UhpB
MRRPLSLYTRVVIVNAAVLIVATAVLAATPARVSFPRTAEDVVVLAAGLALMILVNAILLRVTFSSLARLVSAMRTIDLLRPGRRLPLDGDAEVRQLIATFNDMLDRLEAERRESNRRAHLARETERRRVGRELHDEIGQRLTGILLQLQRAIDRVPPELREDLARTQDLTRSTLDEVGQIAWRLRPGILDDLGISKALEALVDSVVEDTEARVLLRLEEPLPALGPDVEIVIYRVAQEGLTNALRHAEAGEILLDLRRVDGGVRLEVADDGRGFGATTEEGSGLRGMRERALSIGADLRIESGSERGVLIRMDVAPTSGGG